MTQSVHVSTKSKQDYITPPELVQFLARRNGVELVLDLAASPENARCPHYITEAQDIESGGMHWDSHLSAVALDCGIPFVRASAFLNPPFKKAAPFMERAAIASLQGAKIITLTLASLGTNWYEAWVKPYALSLILRERVTFVGCKDAYPKELMVSFFGFGMTGFGWLNWEKEAYANYVPPFLGSLKRGQGVIGDFPLVVDGIPVPHPLIYPNTEMPEAE